MNYEKKIKYLELRENNEKVKGVGFVKLEARRERCSFFISISGLPRLHQGTDRVQTTILLGDGSREVDMAPLELVVGEANGKKVTYEFRDLDMKNLMNTQMAYHAVKTMRIPLIPGKEIYCLIGENTQKRRIEEKEQKASAEQKVFVEQKVSIDRKRDETDKNEAKSNTYAAEQEKIDTESDTFVNSLEDREIEVIPVKESGKKTASKDSRLRPMQEDKWRQLASIYPHIRPFQDEREYLSLTPGDFVVLREQYYGLIHNSFLLHGYYNYKHIILQRMEQRGEVKYFIGVPGNFYEREKQVAVMFGFESFECLEEPARDGDYGYYMMQVEL